MLERAREARNRGGGHAAHEHSGELFEALDAAMNVVETAIVWNTDPLKHTTALRLALANLELPIRTSRSAHRREMRVLMSRPRRPGGRGSK